MVFRSVLLTVLIFFASAIGNAQYNGLPLLSNIEPGEYEASPQNWGIRQLNNGNLVIANDYGLLVFNGRSWKLYEEEVSYLTHCIAEFHGKIFVGTENDILQLSCDSLGQLIFVSALPPIPDSLANFGIVERIVVLDSVIVFSSDHMVFSFNYTKNELNWAESESIIQDVFYFKGNTYAIVEDEGIKRLELNRLIHFTGYHHFVNNNPIHTEETEAGFKVLTSKGGWYEIILDSYGYERQVEKIPSVEDSLFQGKELRGYWDISYNRTAYNTANEGLFIVKNNQYIETHLHNDVGLQDEGVMDVFTDVFGSIWLALNNGISRVDIHYPVRQYDFRNGLEGTVEDIEFHKNQLYVASHTGVYAQNEDYTGFKNVLPIQTWDLESFTHDKNTGLLLATNNDISELKENGNLELIVECYPWKIHELKSISGSFIIGTDPGAFAIKKDQNNWASSQDFTQIIAPINNFNESQNGLWFGARNVFAYKSQSPTWLDDSLIIESLTEVVPYEGFPEGEMNVFNWKGHDYVGTVQGIYQYNPEDNRYQQVRNIAGLDSMVHLHRGFSNSNDELWAITLVNGNLQFGYVNGETQWNYRLYNPIAKDVVHAINETPEGDILFGGAGGLFHIKRKHTFDLSTPYSCAFTKIKVKEDSLIHGGYWTDSNQVFTTIQPAYSIPQFHYKTNAISFEFASLTFGDSEDISFSYWLEGNDEHWSKWTEEHKKEYTNLPPGEYTFHVKAKNVFDTESQTSTFQFVINKPWFQTTWYYALQTGVLLLLVILTVFSNRSGNPSAFSSIIAFVTIITVFEFLIMTIEPLFMEYTDEIPVFNLIMNILMAASLAPVERLIRKYLAKRKT